MVEDHPLYRVGIRMSLEYSGLDCIVEAETENVEKTLAFLEQHGSDIDLILLDFYLPDGSGCDVIEAKKRYCPAAKIILLSGESNNPVVIAKTEDDVDDYIGKEVESEELRERIEFLFSSSYSAAEKGTRHDLNQVRFTDRELEVIRLCATGLTAQQIADQLNLSRRTVETHKNNVFAKVKCRTTAELINYAYKHGIA